MNPAAPFNPQTDLLLERVVPVPPQRVWRAWTQPEHITQWFCPAPWRASECAIDMRPGGVFRFVIVGPEGERFEHVCCYLEVVPGQRLVWTTLLGPGWRPRQGDAGVPPFTAVISIEPEGEGTRYSACAMHVDAAGAKTHGEMGFSEGWGNALDQLVALAQKGEFAR